MKYNKVTEAMPDVGRKVMCYNGETEFKNYYEEDGWRYQYKYPITHWHYLNQTPSDQEVQQVRQQLT